MERQERSKGSSGRSDDIRAQIILGNTYHLYLRPGTHVLETAGGLHKFYGLKRPILTTAAATRKQSVRPPQNHRRGVRSAAIDGSKHLFSPETSMDIQRSIGADIIMAFDECPPYPSDYGYARESMERTHRWLDRCIAHLDATPAKYGFDQHSFPIVQGSGRIGDLRVASAEAIAERGAAGNAIGGLSVGEPHEDMYAMTEVVCGVLPEDKPRYLMGVGTPENLLENMALGVDMFDCVMPTRKTPATACCSLGTARST